MPAKSGGGGRGAAIIVFNTLISASIFPMFMKYFTPYCAVLAMKLTFVFLLVQQRSHKSQEVLIGERAQSKDILRCMAFKIACVLPFYDNVHKKKIVQAFTIIAVH